MNDFRFAVRRLFKNSSFTAVAVLTLAFGIGANTTVFTVVKTLLLRPLGFPEADRLVWIYLQNTQTGMTDDRLSWREMQDIRDSTRSFASIGTFGAYGITWEQGEVAEMHPALTVTENFAEILGVRPVLGRPFISADFEESVSPVVLISYELWQSRFDGNAQVLGQDLRLDKKVFKVVGVLPPKLEFPVERAPQAGTGSNVHPGARTFWFPMKDPHGSDFTSRGARMFLPVARLKAGVPELAAREELNLVGARLAKEFPETNRHLRFNLINFRDQILGGIRHGIPLLGVAVAAVLLICCANLANLLLARSVSQHRDLAVRLALGGGARRLIRSVLAEALLIGLAGGFLGALLTVGALRGLQIVAAEKVPFIREVQMDWIVIAFTLALSLFSAVLFGVLPAWRQIQTDPADSLRSGSRTTGSAQLRAWQRGLLIGQVAIVLVLLATAGLLLESFRRLIQQDLGYRPGSVLAADIETWNFESNEEMCRLYRSLQARLAALPGVQAVGTVSSAPLTGKWTFDERAQVFGQSLPEADRPSLAATFVAFDYFQALGISLVDGRLFRESELKDSGYGKIVVLNESAARSLFPGRSAVGGRFTVGSNPDRVLEVIGVVRDTRDVRLEQKPEPRFYWQYAFGGAQIIIRTSTSLQALMPLVRDTIQQTDRRILRQTIKPMSEIVSSTVAGRQFLMTMLSLYALLSLLIAAVGIGGVVAYQVAERTNEFGIRLALGSSRKALLRLVLGHSARTTVAGLCVGLLLSFAASRFIASLLFDISPLNPMLLLLVCGLVLLVALGASFWPARRAARIDPIVALRYE